MTRTFLAIATLCLSMNAYGNNSGTEACHSKAMFLSSICRVQTLVGSSMEFAACANGYQYRIATNLNETNKNLLGKTVSCKMIEVRNKNRISERITYFDSQANRVVEYKHTSGLSNTFVYGHTGYYHVSELANGDALYNFYSFEN